MPPSTPSIPTCTTDAGCRQGTEISEDCAGLLLGVESECASTAVDDERLGLGMAALLFCTDNVFLPREEDQHYGGLRDRRVRSAFECGLETVVEVLRTEE